MLRKVMIRCATSGRPLHTGLDVREETFQSLDLTDRRVHCPHCGDTHLWSKADAWLEDEDPRVR
jgi:hypothetical protein